MPTIRSRRDEIERDRRMPRDLVERLRQTGLFLLGVPRDLGGLEAEPTDLLTAIEMVARGDGSAGWCAMIATANGVTAGYTRRQGAEEVFNPPDAPTAGIAAPSGAAVRTDGGVMLSGRWSFASGITHCEWLWAGAMVMEDGAPRMTDAGPEIVYLWFPVADVEIHDTWFVSGLSGTGSNDFSVREIFVPDRRIFDLLDAATHRPEPLYQMPAVGWFASQLASVSLGIARAAIDELVEIGQTKVPTLYRSVLADRPATQIEVGRQEAALQAARAFLFGSVEDLYRTLAAGRPLSPRQIALNRLAALQAVETGAAVAAAMNVQAGGSAIYSASTLQRHARDAEVMRHHFTVSTHAWEEAGRVLLGRQPSVPVF